MGDNQKHADAHIVAAQEMALFGARLQTLEVKLNTAIADLEFRVVVLESRMENVLARLDGHDLGFVTMGLDEEGKKALARMQRIHRCWGERGPGRRRALVQR